MKRVTSFLDAQKQWELSKFSPNIAEKTSTANFIFRVIHEGFVGNVPIEVLEKFPGSWVVVTFALTYFIFFGCYVGFFVWGYYEGLNQTFISLDSSAGLCNEVAKPLTGTFLASSRGVWEGSADFKYSEAMYSFTFNELTTNTAEFDLMINKDFSLSASARKSANQDIATNMLVWMQYRKSVATSNHKVQSMTLFSSPYDAFDRAIVEAGTYANVYPASSFCLAEYTSFDDTTATVLMKFLNSSNCQHFVDGLGSLGRRNGVYFETSMKLTTFSTAAAINSNIITMDQLERLYVIAGVDFEGVSYSVDAMYDPSYHRADTLICADFGNRSFGFKEEHKQLCAIDGGGILLIPVLGHADEHCASCDDSSAKATVSCEYFGMLSFYIFFPTLRGNNTAQDMAFLDLFRRVNTTQIRKAVSRLYQFQDAGLFDQMCQDCAVIWAYLGDDVMSISPYRRLIPTGIHCVDSITSTNFSALGTTPPVQLVENYYVCRTTVTNNILNSVGLAFGNTSIFAVLFLAIILPILFFLTNKFDPHKRLVRKYVLRHATTGMGMDQSKYNHITVLDSAENIG